MLSYNAPSQGSDLSEHLPQPPNSFSHKKNWNHFLTAHHSALQRLCSCADSEPSPPPAQWLPSVLGSSSRRPPRAALQKPLVTLAPRPGLGGGLNLLFPFRALWSSVESNLNLKKKENSRITEGGGDRLAEREGRPRATRGRGSARRARVGPRWGRAGPQVPGMGPVPSGYGGSTYLTDT